MNKELNIGDYVRTKDNGIAKIIDSRITKKGGDIYCTVQTVYTTYITDNNLYLTDGDIIKISPNIIDLIEVGDYVNGERVEWIGYDLYRENEDKTLTGIGEKRILFNEFTKDSVREKSIKSILTKEQFESMEYKIGE